MDEAVEKDHPFAPFVDKHCSEMTVDESRFVFAWLQIVIERAAEEKVEGDVREVLYGWHKEAFTHLVSVFPTFRDRILSREATLSTNPETWGEYFEIARKASES